MQIRANPLHCRCCEVVAERHAVMWDGGNSPVIPYSVWLVFAGRSRKRRPAVVFSCCHAVTPSFHRAISRENWIFKLASK
jgi:hypothetical protein